MTLSGTTILGQSGHGSDGNEGVPCILQSSSIIDASPSDCLVSSRTLIKGVLLLCRDSVNVFYSPSRLGKQGDSQLSERLYEH